MMTKTTNGILKNSSEGHSGTIKCNTEEAFG